MRITVRRHTGEVVVVDATPSTSAVVVATRAASAHGFDVFDAAWCLGVGGTPLPTGGEVSSTWIASSAAASTLDEDEVYLLAVLPDTKGGLN